MKIFIIKIAVDNLPVLYYFDLFKKYIKYYKRLKLVIVVINLQKKVYLF